VLTGKKKVEKAEDGKEGHWLLKRTLYQHFLGKGKKKRGLEDRAVVSQTANCSTNQTFKSGRAGVGKLEGKGKHRTSDEKLSNSGRGAQ